jgi:lipopolysaccharide transport system ATP-binding protein
MVPILRTVELSKKYPLGERERYYALRDTIGRWIRKPFHLFKKNSPTERRKNPPWIWALKDISIEVFEGEVVGIIGKNGAGKSTLLKILARVTEPTRGYAEVWGRVGSLLEVGTGFHPELTGEENIFLSGAILGMKRKEIQKKFSAIVEFAEVEPFLKTPVKHYSSGMQVRLGFAVAAHLEPEILLVDEVLAVGDASFQKKCLGKMGEISRSGRTILFVSHNMGAVQALCSRSYLLDQGRIVREGSTRDVISYYLQEGGSSQFSLSLKDRKDRTGNGKIRFRSVEIVTPGYGTGFLLTGEPGEIRLYYEGYPPLRDVHVTMAIGTLLQEWIFYLSNEMTGDPFPEIPSRGAFVLTIPKVPLLPSTYIANLCVAVRGEIADWIQSAIQIPVEGGDFFSTGKLPPPGYGHTALLHRWHVEER